MKRAIFLVTTIQGIRKPTFLKQLLSLISEHYEIVILFAMTNFDEVWQARREFKAMSERDQLVGIRTITLGDVYAEHKGILLDENEYLQPDLTKLKSFEAHEGKHRVMRYVDGDGNIVAETLFAEDGIRLHTILFDRNSRIIQVNNYNQQDQLYGIEKYRDDFIEESLLLNQQKKLIFRFTNNVQVQKVSYAVAETALIPVPAELSEVQKAKKDDPLTQFETVGESVETRATSYSDYHRYDNINAFYHQVLLNMDIDDARIYLDINNVVDASKYLPGKQIFNY